MPYLQYGLETKKDLLFLISVRFNELNTFELKSKRKVNIMKKQQQKTIHPTLSTFT